MRFFKKRQKNEQKNKQKNTQPGNARIARRAVTLAKLAELYSVTLSEENTARLAGRLGKTSDDELNRMSASPAPIIGCAENIIPLFAGYSELCAGCVYYNRDSNKCLLIED